MKLKNRHFLRNNETKALKKEITEKYGPHFIDSLFPPNAKIEIAELEELFTVYIINGITMLIRIEKDLIPSLKALIDNKLDLKQITVDSGAIKFILNGADVMRPGITSFDDNIAKNDYVKITEESCQHPIAIGMALLTSNDIKSTKTGKIVKNIHFINDKLWKLLESIH